MPGPCVFSAPESPQLAWPYSGSGSGSMVSGSAPGSSVIAAGSRSSMPVVCSILGPLPLSTAARAGHTGSVAGRPGSAIERLQVARGIVQRRA